MNDRQEKVPPSIRAARARGAARPSDGKPERAYPAVDVGDDAEAAAVRLAATRALLAVRTPQDVAAVVATLVQDLGGELRSARRDPRARALPLDVSLGLSEPMLPWAEPVSLASMRLGAVLPDFLEDARAVLGKLAGGRVRAQGDRGPMTANGEEALERYFRTVEDVDAIAATDILLELHESGTPTAEITSDVLCPAQVRVGELWEQGVWTVADEHAATAVTETALAALTAATARRTATTRHVVVACAEGEWHTLPARMAAAVVSAGSDARVTLLGPSLPAEQLGRRLAAGDVDLLALSCTLPTNLLGAARSIAAARAAGVPVIAGGRAFGRTAQRAEAIGADAWAAEAADLLGPVPERTGVSSSVPHETLLLDGVSEMTVALAYDRLVGAYPGLETMTPSEQARTREDLRWIARFTAATVLTADVTVLDDFLGWLGRLLDGKVPLAVLATSARMVADVVEPQAPLGAQLLSEAADRFEKGGSSPTD